MAPAGTLPIDLTMIRAVMPRTLRRHAAWAVATALLSAASILVGSLLASSLSDEARRLNHDPGLTTIRVGSGSNGAGRPVVAGDLPALRGIPAVADVTPFAQIRIDIGEPARRMWLTPQVAALDPDIVAGVAPIRDDEILVPDAAAGSLPLGTVHEFRVTAAGRDPTAFRVTVVGTFDNSLPGYAGAEAVYTTNGLVSAVLTARSPAGTDPDALGYDAAFVRVASVADVATVEEALRARGYATESVAGAAPSLSAGLSVLSWSSPVLVVIVAIVALMSGTVLGSGLRAERASEVGVLRALGWQRARIVRLYLCELTCVAAAVAITAVALGLGACWATSWLAAGREWAGVTIPATPSPGWSHVVLTVVGVPAGAIVGGLRAVLAVAGRPPDDAIREL
ncbi:FtsX-like permease family protein [Propionicicella superfundia]|uniref:FtsX-like permease family protein n=1 Tax=Propionicicella superfundia TaxID=348582 RepID=UPI0003F77166|nr:FtsX-like permease family protein [Propionicicella superfundia]